MPPLLIALLLLPILLLMMVSGTSTSGRLKLIQETLATPIELRPQLMARRIEAKRRRVVAVLVAILILVIAHYN